MSYEFWNYVDLGIVSVLYPSRADLFIETDDGSIYMPRSTNASRLVKSSDKGQSWVEINIFAEDIQGMWYDRINNFIYGIYTRSGNDRHRCFKIDIDDNDNVLSFGEWTQGTHSVASGHDIFIIGASVYCNTTNTTTNSFIKIWKYDAGWAEEASFQSSSGQVAPTPQHGVVIGTVFYFWYKNVIGGALGFMKFDSIGSTLTRIYSTGAYDLSSRVAQRALSYDGNNIIAFTLNKDADGLDYLMNWDITEGTITEVSLFDIGVMADRNTDPTDDLPFSLERAFHITDDKLYQLDKSRGTFNLISTISTDTVWIAISPHYAMNSGGDMY
ncbi:hypothetical protein LCGC14_1519270, partial [marine sediment metagenome]